MSDAQCLFAIGMQGVDLRTPPKDVREEFARTRSLRCRHIFEPSFLERLGALIDRASWTQDGQMGLLFRKTETPGHAGNAISHALRRPELMRWIEMVTGCDRLGSVSGHVQQIEANPETELEWHNDLAEPGRRIAITINLGSEAYEGGTFEMRSRERLLTTHRHQERGSALLFDVGPQYQHRVLPVTSGGPRRVYAGWFYREGQLWS